MCPTQALKQEKQEHCEMIRDMDLVRDILLKIEQDPTCNYQHSVVLEMPDHPDEEVLYHTTLLIQAGFVTGVEPSTSILPVVSGLTWQGHEFLDNIRDPGIWSKTKEKIKGLKSVALSVLVQIAEAEVKKHLGLT